MDKERSYSNTSLHAIDFFELTDELFCVLDRSGKIREINKNAWKGTLGFEVEDLIGKKISKFISKKDRHASVLNALDLLKRNSSQQFEVRFKDKNNNTVWLSCVIKSDEPRTAFYLTGRNISHQVKQRGNLQLQSNALSLLSKDAEMFSGDIEQAYRKITRLSSETLKVSLVSIWLYNDDRNSITAVNRYDSRNKEYSAGTVLTSEDYPHYFEAMEEERIIDANNARIDERTCEFTENYLKPLGIYSMLDAPIFLEGRSIGVICHEHVDEAREWSPDEKAFASSLADFLSISMATNNLVQLARQLKEQNIELEKINEELDLFVYSSSHQLRSPLASMLGLINLLENDVSEQQRSNYIDLVKKSVTRLDETIREINNYYKNLRTSSVSVKTDLEATIDQIIDDLTIQDNKSVEITKSVKALHDLYSDPQRIYVALSNLISNALKYRDPNKKAVLIIEAVVNREDCIISIEDNGIGIPESSQEKVFEMFYRATSESDGSGLGLYIVKEIVERLNGTIKLSSQPGKYSRFEIKFPNNPKHAEQVLD